MSSWQSQIVRSYLYYNKITTNYDHPIAILRQAVEKAARFGRFPKSVQSQNVTIEHMPAEWHIPRQADMRSAILYLHGGGYALGSIKSHRAIAGQIAEAGKIRTLIIGYRLAPEHPFPAALQDAVMAYDWLRRNGYEKVIIAGDSAGGGLAIATVIFLRDNQALMPLLVICISPLMDLEGNGETVITNAQYDPMLKVDDIRLCKLYIGQNNPRNPLISPLYADFANLPPIVIHVGANEILLSDSTGLAETARKAGVEVQIKIWQEMWHVFPFFAPFLPEATQAITEIGDVIRQKMS